MLTLNPFLFYLLYVTLVDALYSQSAKFYKRHNKFTLTVVAKAIQLKPEGVQVVEGVGLVDSGFQFFTRLGSVFTEEVDDIFFIAFDGPV